MDVGFAVVQIIDTFSDFVYFFFTPLDNAIITNLLGPTSLFEIIFGFGLTVVVVYQLVIWVLNVIT